MQRQTLGDSAMTCAGRSEGWRGAQVCRGVLVHKQESHLLLPPSRMSYWWHWELCCYPVASDIPSRTGLARYQRLRFPGRRSVLCSQCKSLRSEWWIYQIPCTASSPPNLVTCITVTLCTRHNEILVTSLPALLSWYCMDYRAYNGTTRASRFWTNIILGSWLCISVSIGILIRFSWQNSFFNNCICPSKITPPSLHLKTQSHLTFSPDTLHIFLLQSRKKKWYFGDGGIILQQIHPLRAGCRKALWVFWGLFFEKRPCPVLIVCLSTLDFRGMWAHI